jgi:alkylation response protein AidB-like acyl-CoA dehydrogenase/CBS domain-containing protein
MPSEAEARSRQVAESARETQWKRESFLRDLFLGSFRLDLVRSPPDGAWRPEFRAYYDRLKSFLETAVDPVAIDETGEYPREVIDGLAAMGAFGMKIPTEYGGLGFSQSEYETAMQLVGSHDANVTALLSAHQSIGVPQPLKLFGTEAQKREYLPRCARGAISGFALTEPAVGSDPARIATVAEPSADGASFLLNGVKLWCTNGTLAELLVVIARTPPHDRLSAFIIETRWKGVTVVHRCRFMGLKALANAELEFHDVRVPRENLIGEEGRGLKIALATLNTGRLTLPAATTGGVKACLEICRKWSNVRVQWGQPIGKHEAIAHKLADLSASAFAMDSLADLAARLADRQDYDIRLEAAAAKEWNTVRAWQAVDDALEIRGGRGYETERSLAARGEVPIGIERMMRDWRINRIFEGSSEIMHLFIAREALDKHLRVAGALVDPKSTRGQKLRALLRAALFYVVWYPALWLHWGRWPRHRRFGRLGTELRYIERTTRKLARSTFYGMLVHRARLERKQAFLFRIVDVAIDLFVMTAAVLHARRLEEAGAPAARDAFQLARLFCRTTRRAIAQRFRAMWHNDDALRYEAGRALLAGRFEWLEEGIVGLHRSAESLARFAHAQNGSATGRKPMKCSKLMKTDVECCPQEENVEAAAERMRRRNVGFLPVCSQDGSIVGTITDRDLAIRVLAEHRSAGTTAVAEVMSRELVCCSPDDELDVAESLMSKHKKSRIVCADDRKHPVGVISLSDIARVEEAAKLSGILESIASREALQATP